MDENLWEPLDPSWPMVGEEFQFNSFDDDSLSDQASTSPSRSPSASASPDRTDTTDKVPAKRGRKCTSVVPRKDRNKASALKYRQRKKEYTGQLEAQVAGLAQLVEQQQKEIHDLRTENKIMTQQLEFVKNFMTSGIAGGVPQTAPSSTPPPPPFVPAFPFAPPSFKAPRPPDASTYYSLLAHPAMYLGLLGCCLILAPLPSSATSVSASRGRVLLALEASNEWQLYFSSLVFLVRTLSILFLYLGLLLVGAIVLGLFGSRFYHSTTFRCFLCPHLGSC